MATKKLLGIIASYRKQGNCETVAKAVARELGSDWELNLVRLPLLKIEPCKGCYACLLPGKDCNLDDDVEWLLETIADADAVVFAAANYILGPVGIVKMLTDRALQMAPYAPNFKNKRTAVALTMGQPNFRGYSDSVLASQVGGIGLKADALEVFLGTHPAEVAMKDDFNEKIKRMAESITAAEPPKEDRPNRCPACRSDLFRVGPDGIECAMCKHLAEMEDGSLKFTTSHHQFSAEGIQEHMEWLLMKKLEFSEVRDKLMVIRNDYGPGDWLTPPSADEARV